MTKVAKIGYSGRLILLALTGLATLAQAAEVQVTVLDRDGAPVPDVAVYLESTGSEGAADLTAKMDQVDTQFVPHMLIIQKGTRVDFPNSDIIAHHVYSFSDPNDFMLPLYKGDVHPAVSFDHPGLVTLGCNIHDQMLGYIFVVDGPVFGMTDINGQVTLDVGPEVGGSISIWSPRMRQRGEVLTQLATADGVEFRLRDKLRPISVASSGGVQWTDY